LARDLPLPFIMLKSPGNSSQRAQRETIIILGGKGGLQARYRQTVENFGYELRHYEKRVPPKHGSSHAKVAMVIVMVTMISHPLMAQARALAGAHAAVVYLKSPSLSAVRETVSRRQ
jgi:hypothetical protein